MLCNYCCTCITKSVLKEYVLAVLLIQGSFTYAIIFVGKYAKGKKSANNKQPFKFIQFSLATLALCCYRSMQTFKLHKIKTHTNISVYLVLLLCWQFAALGWCLISFHQLHLRSPPPTQVLSQQSVGGDNKWQWESSIPQAESSIGSP